MRYTAIHGMYCIICCRFYILSQHWRLSSLEFQDYRSFFFRTGSGVCCNLCCGGAWSPCGLPFPSLRIFLMLFQRLLMQLSPAHSNHPGTGCTGLGAGGTLGQICWSGQLQRRLGIEIVVDLDRIISEIFNWKYTRRFLLKWYLDAYSYCQCSIHISRGRTVWFQ